MGDVKKIALITSTSNFERHKNIIRAIHRNLKKRGGYVLYVFTCYGIFLEQTPYDIGEGSIYSLLDEADFDGVIIEGNLGIKEMMEEFTRKLKKRNIPYVAANFGLEDTPFVITDAYDSACQMMEHLINEHKCTKINLVSTSVDDSIVVASMKGYEDTLQKYGIEMDERRIVYRSVSIFEGRKILEDFIESDIMDAEAVICVHDVHSIGLCLEMQDRGYKIPDDMLVCSLNRSTNSVAFMPDISGVDRMDSKIADKACELLIDAMAGKEIPLEIYSTGEIFFGRSCGCTNNQAERNKYDFQQLILSKIEMGNQVRQMMQYNDSLDEVESLDGLLENMKNMYRGINCPQFILCLNQGAIDFISSDKSFHNVGNGRFFDETMHAVCGYTQRTGQLEKVDFPLKNLAPVEVQEGDMLLFYPVHHIENVYGYTVFLNEFLPIDIYNYRICHESIASSMDNLHRQMILRKSISLLDELHMHDALTGLHNRFAWVRFCSDYTSKNAYCVVYMDMDGLKKINDSFGHSAGNVAIKITANAIKNAAHDNDLVTRCGGDEFQVLSSCVDDSYWKDLQYQINEEIDREIAAQGLPYHFGVSYGYCICGKEQDMTFDECCDRADKLMYADKKMRKAERVD